MANTVNVVGLFDDTNRVGSVVAELTSRGFNRDDIEILNSGTGASGSVASRLAGLGAPESDAGFYSRGVESGGTLVAVRTTEDRLEEAMEILNRFGALPVEDGTARTETTRTDAAGETAIPVVEEQLRVGKRAVQSGGVRIYNRVVETPVEETVHLREENVRVERHAVDRPATEADLSAFKEGSIELTERSEEAVVSKQARVVEEVVVGKEATERTETVRDTVRRTDVQVEEIPGETTRTTVSEPVVTETTSTNRSNR